MEDVNTFPIAEWQRARIGARENKRKYRLWLKAWLECLTRPIAFETDVTELLSDVYDDVAALRFHSIQRDLPLLLVRVFDVNHIPWLWHICRLQRHLYEGLIDAQRFWYYAREYHRYYRLSPAYEEAIAEEVIETTFKPELPADFEFMPVYNSFLPCIRRVGFRALQKVFAREQDRPATMAEIAVYWGLRQCEACSQAKVFEQGIACAYTLSRPHACIRCLAEGVACIGVSAEETIASIKRDYSVVTMASDVPVNPVIPGRWPSLECTGIIRPRDVHGNPAWQEIGSQEPYRALASRRNVLECQLACAERELDDFRMLQTNIQRILQGDSS